jgi:hypothetical protein
MAAIMKTAVFWVAAMIATIIDAACTSETSAKFYQVTQHNHPENGHLHFHPVTSLFNNISPLIINALLYHCS